MSLNTDVVLDLLEHLSLSDLATFALLHRALLDNARLLLYGRIHLVSDSAQAAMLSRTLRDCAHLRRLVHHIVIHQSSGTAPLGQTAIVRECDPAQWLGLLPTHCLQSLDIQGLVPTSAFFHYPAIMTVPRIVLRDHAFSLHNGMWVLLSSSHLHSLSVHLDPRAKFPGLMGRVPLEQLSVQSWAHSHATSQILDAVTPSTLERFGLDVGHLVPEDAMVFSSHLRPHLASLKQLTLIIRSPTVPYIAFADELIFQAHSLERLVISAEVRSPLLVAQLPKTLRSLTFVGEVIVSDKVLKETVSTLQNLESLTTSCTNRVSHSIAEACRVADVVLYSLPCDLLSCGVMD